MFQYKDYIYEIYKTGSFSGAAENLYLTQPALSIAVKKEEKALGQPLFERGTSPLSLTEAGKAYIESVEKINNIETSLVMYCNDLSQLKTGSIRVGASNFFLSHVVLSIIAEFSRQYPGIVIDVQEAPSPELKNRILKEELDIIIDPLTKNDHQMQSQVLFCEQFLLAVPAEISTRTHTESYSLSREQILKKRHLDSHCPCVSLSVFSEEPFILLRPDTVTYGHAMEICRYFGFSPKIRFCLDQQITSYHFAGKGLGITLVSDVLVRLTPPETDLVFYKIDLPMARREVAAIHKKNRYMTRAAAAFMKTAAELTENNHLFSLL